MRIETKLEGEGNLYRALDDLDDNLAKSLDDELVSYLRPVVDKAKSYIPTKAPLSGWGKPLANQNPSYRPFPKFNAFEARAKIGYETRPQRKTKNGFLYGALIYNASASGGIYETAGRKNPNGRAVAQDIYRKKFGTPYGVDPRNPKKIGRDFKSNNPFASYQFIAALPPITKAAKTKSKGRKSRKMDGRVIFRAWAETNGQVRAKCIKAIETTKDKFNKTMQRRLAA